MIRIESDGAIEFSLQMLERASCSIEERRTLFPLVEQIMDLTERAGKDGIFALEKEAKDLRPRILGEGVSLAVGGNCCEYIARELYYRAFCGAAGGVELLRSLICIEGVRGIQQAWHPIQVRDTLLAFLGAEMIEEAEQRFDMSRDAMRAHLADRLAEIESLPVHEPGTLLEEPIGKMRDMCVYRLTASPQFSKIPLSDVAVALSNASDAVRKKVFAMMPLKQALYVVDNWGFSVKTPTEVEERERRNKWILRSQAKVVEVIETLKKMGEIF